MTVDKKAFPLELKNVHTHGRGELEAWWRQIYGRHPPSRTSRELMVRAVSYHIQKERHGGLDRKTQRRLDQLAAGRTGTMHKKLIKPGTRLIREWHGEVHDVLVLEEGFAFRGRIHRSLTAIAREITGTAWNGYRFFGLRKSEESTEPLAAAGRDHPATEPADG